MSEYDGTILFKEWLPDLPDLNNPGLTEARNCIPINGTYKSFDTFSTSLTLGSVAETVNGSFSTYTPTDNYVVFVGTDTKLYENAAGTGFTNLSAATYSTAAGRYWRFAQYQDLVIATNWNNAPQYNQIAFAGNFATLGSTAGTAPRAQQVGRIGQFIMLGDTITNEAHVQWSSIDDVLSWPTPGSATAIAAQAGEQYLSGENGKVSGISSGDQFGLIFQLFAITRATYIGGSAVFQFDEISKGRGMWYPNSIVQVGGLTYFIAHDGFYRTDGVQVQPIGRGKVDKWFRDNVAQGNNYQLKVYGAVDMVDNVIYWAFPEAGSNTGIPTHILMYSLTEDRFSRAVQTVRALVAGVPYQAQPYNKSAGPGWVKGFSTANALGYFSGTPGTAIFTTAELELNPAGYTEEVGVKPLLDVTLNAVTVAMGTRNNRTDAVSYSSEQTANSRSGFANFRASARYHRARLTVAGTFNAAQGLEYQANASGYT
jgi:hypothetical protein